MCLESPQHAHSSAYTHLIKFLVVIRGARTPPPINEAPVTKMPLQAMARVDEFGKARHRAKHAPARTKDAQTDAEADASCGPCIRT